MVRSVLLTAAMKAFGKGGRALAEAAGVPRAVATALTPKARHDARLCH